MQIRAKKLDQITHLCRPVRSTFAVRETASLGIMRAPRVPPLNLSETIVGKTVGKNGLNKASTKKRQDEYRPNLSQSDSSRSQSQVVLGFEKFSDNSFSFPSRPLHNYYLRSVPNLPQRHSPSSHTYGS